MPEKENFVMALMEAPTRLNKFIDACTCGRADKAALTALKKELEKKDTDIERLEEEIRRKDSEKDNLIHMQKDLQNQIEEIRLLLESHATEAQAQAAAMSDDKAAALMQRRARGIAGRKKVEQIKKRKAKDDAAVVALQARTRGVLGRKQVEEKVEAGVLPGQQRQKESTVAVKLQARARGKSARKLVEEKAAAGVLPGQQRQGGATPESLPTAPAPATIEGGEEEGDYVDEVGEEEAGGSQMIGLSEGGSSYFDENESVDSDYDYEESEVEDPGAEMLSGKLKLAKVYGQEEPPAAEDELEWEVRYFVLYDSGRIVHHDDLQDGLPVGDRGLIYLSSIRAVEKVLGVNTFVMKGTSKVYLFKLEPDDEVMMRTWINAISQELERSQG